MQKIAILGTGAIGASVGLDLIEAGHDVILIDQWPAHVDAMKQNGLFVKMPGSEHQQAVKAYHLNEIYTLNPQLDVVLLCAKSYDSMWLTQFIKPYLKSDGVLVCVQNSFNDEWVAPIIGKERDIPCVIELSAAITEPGKVQRNTNRQGTWLGLGELDGQITPRLEALKNLLSIVGTTELTNNIFGSKWSKLIANSMTQGPIGMLGMKSSEAVLLDGFFEIALAAGMETFLVAKAAGFTIEPVFGLEQSDFDGSPRNAVELLYKTLVKHIGPHSRNAVVQDHSKGRRTEVDYLNGYVVKKGLECNVPTPMNTAVTKMNQMIADGVFPAEAQNLQRIQTLLT
ncbi:ketopantoate reductase family protein [Polynucleobacter kasalickyi]|uniref:2-dehydropantoate 2-reductase n=1 Tax=Polynucleobacter kasalickyi TaxID=1938817 RepID=A0A1W1Z5F5_9BURK|nr:2-dehydropantoate 2-reductase [Polynucleobacter kasalickyi]SMC43707.1 2-dehydropantoate 2-reductase [Polynucleobacter kasalickyi]